MGDRSAVLRRAAPRSLRLSPATGAARRSRQGRQIATIWPRAARMMTEAELMERIRHHAADRVEFTTSTTDTVKFSEAICPFANDLPVHGRLFVIGVDDEGRFAGVPVTATGR